MAELDQYERLNDAIDAIIARRPVPAIDPELATLLVYAADLRDLPDPRFFERLKGKLMPTATLTKTRLRPYLFVEGAGDLIAFLEKAFDAQVLLRVPHATGGLMHAEVLVGDSIVELSDSSAQWKPMSAPLHVYIENVDEVYRRGLAAGATSIFAPTNRPYGDREAGLTDRFGNHYFIATHLEGGPRPPGYATVTTGFRVAGAEKMLAFLQQAFGAAEVEITRSPSGQIGHGELRIGETMVELSEASAQWGPTKGAIHLFVGDCDAVYNDALRAGATSVTAPEDKPYGERQATLADPFGNLWFIATPLSA